MYTGHSFYDLLLQRISDLVLWAEATILTSLNLACSSQQLVIFHNKLHMVFHFKTVYHILLSLLTNMA